MIISQRHVKLSSHSLLCLQLADHLYPNAFGDLLCVGYCSEIMFDYVIDLMHVFVFIVWVKYRLDHHQSSQIDIGKSYINRKSKVNHLRIEPIPSRNKAKGRRNISVTRQWKKKYQQLRGQGVSPTSTAQKKGKTC